MRTLLYTAGSAALFVGAFVLPAGAQSLAVTGSAKLALSGDVTVSVPTLTVGSSATLALGGTSQIEGDVSNSGTLVPSGDAVVTGAVSQTVGTSPVTFPVGTSTLSLPVTMQFASGSAPVTVEATGGDPTDGRAAEPGVPVQATWLLTGTPPAAATMTFAYPAAAEPSGFDETQAFAARYDGAAWQSFRATSTPTPGDPALVTVTGVTQFSPWAIFSSAADVALPVELTGFSAAAGDGRIVLSWQTASETNNAGFIVVRDGQPLASFHTLPALRGSGTTSSAHRYGFTDQRVQTGRSYRYTLQSVDRSGAVHAYPASVEAMVEEVAPTTFALHPAQPNPFNPATTLQLDLPEPAEVTVEAYNLLGQSVRQLVGGATLSAGRHPLRFEASGLSSGVYVVRLVARTSSGQRLVQSRRVVLAR